jgi:RNA polymerase subunit RPABC4/transcription elongation factor Spt4
VLAQRLARVICHHCKETYPANDTELMILGYPKTKELCRGKGCEHCNWTGYKGRIALYEYLRIEDNLHRLILDRASPYTVRHAAQRNGMVLMAEYAKRAVLAGTTTVAEIQRAVLSEDSQEQVCQNCMRIVSNEFAVCPFCQQMLKEKCEVCKNPVESDWEACPCCGHEITREWRQKHCARCLAPVPAIDELCPYCGGDVA